MAVLPPLPRMLFWIGYVTEQALVINIAGFGLVLISGCGHPRIEQILGITERVLDVPINAADAALQAATGLQQLLAFRHDRTAVTTPAEQAAATAGLTRAAAGLGKAAEALHGSSSWPR